MNNSYPKAFLFSATLTGSLFCLIILLFKALGILLVSEQTLNGPTFSGIPILMIFVQFAVPTIGLCLYIFLNKRFPNNDPDKFSLTMSNVILGICVAMLFFGYLKSYTLVTFLILFSLILYIEYKNKLRFMYRFYRTYVVLLVPFYLLCLFIKNQAQLSFNSNATLKLNVAALPVETYAYFMGMLLTTIFLFELFKNRELNTRG